MPKDLQTADFEYFRENRTALYEKYGHRYLAIKNKSVLGDFDTFDDAVKTTLKAEQPGTFIVQECTDSNKNYTHMFQNNVSPSGVLTV
jgi:hypothetical protein